MAENDHYEWPKWADHNLPSDDYLRTLAIMTLEWSRLEQSIEHLIWILLDINPDAGQRLTTHIGNVTRNEILFSLSGYRNPPETHDAINHLIKLVECNRANRNHLIHATSQWQHGDRVIVQRVQAKRGLKRSF